MKFLLDQSADARLVTYLRQLGHDVTRIARDYPPGLLDPKILSLARAEGRILITDDRDFGELIFRLQLPHAGVIFLRLGTYAPLDLIRPDALCRPARSIPRCQKRERSHRPH
jgi:predicted nuclease of predicted toxin-antitoxin system